MPLLIALLLRLLNISYARDAAGDLTIGLTKLNNATSFSTVTNPDLDSPLSSPATLRGSEATHVPILTSDNGHKALHLDHESNVFVYFYASKTYPASTSHALSFVQTYSKTSSLPNLNLYRVDCDSPLSQFLCFEESITAFPCFIYYKGDDEGVQWLPKKQGFDGKLYEQGFESVFMVDFIKEELIQPKCTPSTLSSCSTSSRELLESYTSSKNNNLTAIFTSTLQSIDDLRSRRFEEMRDREENLWTRVELREMERKGRLILSAYDFRKILRNDFS